MAAQIGGTGLEMLGDALPSLLVEVTGAQPERAGDWVHLGRLGFRSTQRLWIGERPGGGVIMATWPAELKPQAEHLYGRRLGATLVAAALERGWVVEPAPHLAFHTSPPSRRIYMEPAVAPVEYALQWEEPDALRRVGNHTREEVEAELWLWLKQRHYADDADDAELRLFLDKFLLRRAAHMRPGLRFRRPWNADEVVALGPRLGEVMRVEFNELFALADEPTLGKTTFVPGKLVTIRPSGTDAEPPRVVVREAISERVRHEVWRRDEARCVDCGSRERLEFDHIIPICKGGSNTARNLELRCEACNRRKGATI